MLHQLYCNFSNCCLLSSIVNYSQRLGKDYPFKIWLLAHQGSNKKGKKGITRSCKKIEFHLFSLLNKIKSPEILIFDNIKYCSVKYNFGCNVCMILHRSINTYHTEVLCQNAPFHSHKELTQNQFFMGKFIKIHRFPWIFSYHSSC